MITDIQMNPPDIVKLLDNTVTIIHDYADGSETKQATRDAAYRRLHLRAYNKLKEIANRPQRNRRCLYTMPGMQHPADWQASQPFDVRAVVLTDRAVGLTRAVAKDDKLTELDMTQPEIVLYHVQQE